MIDVLGKQMTAKANADGSYDTMTVGNAKQIVSNVGINDKVPYIFRTAGGANDIGDREEDCIIGVSIPWFQVMNSISTEMPATQKGITVTQNTDGSLTFSGTATETGRIALEGSRLAPGNGSKVLLIGLTSGKGIDKWGHSLLSNANHYDTGNGNIGVASSYGTWLYFYVTEGAQVNYTFTPLIFYLTPMFGSAIADRAYNLERAQSEAGMAFIRQFFSKISHISTGLPKIKSVSGLVSHDVTGFNAYNHTTGKAQVVGGNVYQITGTYTALSLNSETVTPDASGYFTPAVSGELTVTGGNATDTCVHLKWDGERDGEYEAYHVNSYPLDSDVTLNGILKLDANNSLYNDGDIYKADGTVTRRYAALTNVTVAKNGTVELTGAKADLTDIITTYGHLADSGTISGTTLTVSRAFSNATIIYERATPITEQAAPYQTPQIVDDWGTEEYVCTPDSDGVVIPVGHDTFYAANLKAKLEMAPDSPGDGDGDYIVRQTDGLNEYVKLVKELPEAPTIDGSYTLKATVSDGAVTLAWEEDAS